MKIPINASAEVRMAFEEVWKTLDSLTRRDINLNGRKIVNAGAATQSEDYMRKSDVEGIYSFDIFYERMKAAGVDGFPGILKELQPAKVLLCTSTTSPKATEVGKLFYESDTGALKFTTGSGYVTITTQSITGLYSARPAATTLANGVLFYATDQNVLYVVNTNAWKYIAGCIFGIKSAVPALAAGDVGVLYIATDTFEYLYWTGTAWASVLVAIDTPTFFVDATNHLVGIGTASPGAKLSINGGLHVGGTSDPGDNNAVVDGTLQVAGQTTLATTLTGLAYLTSGVVGVSTDYYTKTEADQAIAAALATLSHNHSLPADTGGGGSPDHTHTLGGTTGDAL